MATCRSPTGIRPASRVFSVRSCHRLPCRQKKSALVLFITAWAVLGHAKIGVEFQAQLGNPSSTNGSSQIQIVGPVILMLASGTSFNGSTTGNAEHSEWLTLHVHSGGLVLNSDMRLHGTVIAPNGTVGLNGRSMLKGVLVADRLIVNGDAALQAPSP